MACRHSKQSLAAFLALAFLGCGGEPGSADAGKDGDLPERPVAGPYRRDLLFLAPSPSPLAAAVHSSVRPLGNRTARALSAWTLRDGRWTSLAADEWQAAPVRQPWRLLPHGDVRLVVADGGELEWLVFGRGGSGPRLRPGGVVAEWSQGAGERVVLRRGELRTGQGSSAGTVLDVEAGSAGVGPLPGGARAFFVDSAGGAYALVELPEVGAEGLVFSAGEAGPWEAVALEPAPGAVLGWRLRTAEGELVGELRSDEPAEAPATAPPARAGGGPAPQPGGGAAGAGPETDRPPGVTPLRPPRLVRGWVRTEGGRREVVGLVAPEG